MLRVSILAALAISVPAQQLTEGYSAATTTLPAGTNNVLTTDLGTVYFDGSQLWLDDGVSSPQSILSLSFSTFGSFTIPIDSTSVLFGESGTGEVWRASLTGAAPQLVATIAFNYDAVMLTGTTALVSAKTGGFSSPDNDVMFVDVLTGQTQLIARLPGASGPVAIHDNGDVYYATAPAVFPAPAGTVEILRLPRSLIDQTIGSGQFLTAADATVVISGLDAAGDIAFDDDDDLFFVDWFNNRIGELSDVTGPQPTLDPALLDYNGSGLSGSVLQFAPAMAGSIATFEAFQPAGSSLLVHETDFATISQIRTIQALRPQLSSSAANPIGTGAFTLTVDQGPANGIGLLLFWVGAPTGETALALPGFEAQLLVDSTLLAAAAPISTSFDANGSSSIPVGNPGFAPALDATAQVVGLGANGAIGTSQPILLQFGQ